MQKLSNCNTLTALKFACVVISHSLLLRFNGNFPCEPGLAGFIRTKDDGSVGDNWSYKTCTAPVKSSPPTNQHPTFLQARFSSCHTTNSVKALMKI